MVTEQALSGVGRVAAEPTAAASLALTRFTAELYREIAGSPGASNVVCSPYSVAMALGMTVQGACGDTEREMLDVLHADDAASLASGLNGIDAALARRSRDLTQPLAEPTRVDLAPANSLWVQSGVAWRQELLDVLAREFGAGLRTVDYRNEPEAARQAINAWVSERTRERIPQLVAPGVLDSLTRLTLVNAIWFKAPWESPFPTHRTRPQPFHRLDGSRVDADLMRDDVWVGCVAGDGWQAVVLPYAGDELAMSVVVPDAGRFADVEGSIGAWLPQVLGTHASEHLALGLPRWTTRSGAELTGPLTSLGMPTAFSGRADLTGFGGEEPLLIGAVVHEGFVAVDEAGTEAAAATAFAVGAAGVPPPPPRTLAVDRPFLYVIHDLPTRTPLFVGRVLDPTETA